MATIEQRLRAVEKRSQVHNEQIQALFGDTKALSFVAESIGRAFGADNKAALKKIILSLRRYEKFAHDLNEHGMTIARLRATYEFFEGRTATGAVPPSPGGIKPQPRK